MNSAEARDTFADTIPVSASAADVSGRRSVTLPELLKTGRTVAAAQIMRQRGMSLSTALDMLRIYGAHTVPTLSAGVRA